LFEIAGVLGIPLTFDEAMKKKTFGHFARVLREVNLNSNLHEKISLDHITFLSLHKRNE